ncbi:MAG: hypothetical protein Q9222_007686 [Ikaeria aurantiellina]
MLTSSLRSSVACIFLLVHTLFASLDVSINPRGSYGHLVEHGTSNSLEKRGYFNFNNVPLGGDRTILLAAFQDLRDLVNTVVANPNPGVLQNYFDPNDAGDVANVFQTVQQMIGIGGVPNPPHPGFGPTDLANIQIRRSNEGCGPLVLAYSQGVATLSAANTRLITICDFGWNVLFKRLRRDIECSDIGPKVNYKMQFLGGIMLHEILHFNNVGNIAWNLVLGPDQVIDDQPGNFPCFNKAYGPYEATSLRQRDPNAAKINNENYVWYALQTYWLVQCPGSAKNNGDFKYASSNDIPKSCKQIAKGYMKNLWCWLL